MPSLRSLLVKIGVDLSQYTTATDQIKAKQQAIESSFRDSANAMKNWQGTSEGLSLRVNSLNQKIDLQRDYINNLKQSYNAVVAATGPNNEAALKLDKQYQSASVTLDRMNKELTEYRGKLYEAATAEGKTAKEAQNMGGQINKAGNQTGGFKSQLKDFASGALSQFTSIAGGVAIAIQALKALWATITESAKWADELTKLSNKTGIASNELQKMQYASKFLDVEVSTITDGIKRLGVSAFDASKGSKELSEDFKELGIDIYDTGGQLKDKQTLFYETIDALGKMSDATRRDALTMKLMGRNADELNPLIKAGSKALKGYGDEASNTGAIVDNISVAALNHLQDSMDKAAAKTEAVGKRMSASMAPTADTLNTLWEGVKQSAIDSIDVLGRAEKTAVALGASQESMDRLNAAISAKYASGIEDSDEFKAKLKELQAALERDGVSAAESELKALENLANGIDATAYNTQKLTAVQEENAAKTAEAYRVWQEAIKKHEDAVKSSNREIRNSFGGMFDSIPKQAHQSVEAMLKEQKRNVTISKTWAKNLEKLSKEEGFTPEIIQALRDQGVGKYWDINNLTKMTDKQRASWLKNNAALSEGATKAAYQAQAPLQIEVGKSYVAYDQAKRSESQAVYNAKDKFSMNVSPEAAALIGSAVGTAMTGIKAKVPINNYITVEVAGKVVQTDTQSATPTTTIGG
jgi:hypothetical protein